MKVHESNPDLKFKFTCDTCKGRYTTKAVLKRHVLSHESDPDLKYRFFCASCPKRYMLRRELEVHMICHESNPDLRYPFPCKSCKRKFVTKESLTQHTLSHHEMNIDLKYRFKCQLCPKRYTWKSALRNHMLSHADRKFACHSFYTSASCRVSCPTIQKRLSGCDGKHTHLFKEVVKSIFLSLFGGFWAPRRPASAAKRTSIGSTGFKYLGLEMGSFQLRQSGRVIHVCYNVT